MFDIITIGSTTFDNFVLIDAETMFWDRVPSKRALVFPFGEKVEIKKIIYSIGGNSANAAITFARQNLKTACLAKIGKDIYGDFILKNLKKERINIKYIIQDNSKETAYSIILLQKGERTILSYHGASNYLQNNDLKNLNQFKSKWWYVSLAGESYKIFQKIVNFAYQNKIALAFNPSGYHLMKDKNTILKNLSKISVLILNEEEASILMNIKWQKEKEIFKKLDKLMPGILIITKGRDGAMVSDNRFIYRSGIFKEKKLVDRTGAGDAYGSGFVASLILQNIDFYNFKNITEQNILHAINFATANSTSVVEFIGATTGILKLNDFKKSVRFKDLKIQVEKI
ncbi:MAG: carbohydrate kinase family protein [Patescibacteria group bacterium]|nr:carbohydrate kinase family protein [Patescibacteria group bacterium]MCX7589970.1 carbohydrate kinase family protein [Patescibacteria group bacterium]MDW8279675.1 carbohydrate kinase family protein [bacterium]